MKFKLVESIDIELLEKTNPDKERHTHVYADANTSSYRLRGLKGDILQKYSKPLYELCIDIMQGDIVAAQTLFNDISNTSNWQTHHINGLHVDSSITDLDNLALVSNHTQITNDNKKLVDRLFANQTITGVPDIDKLLFRLLVVLKANNKNPSDIFRIPVHRFDVLVNNVLPDETSKEFYRTYPTSTPSLIRLCDLKQYMK